MKKPPDIWVVTYQCEDEPGDWTWRAEVYESERTKDKRARVLRSFGWVRYIRIRKIGGRK